MKNTFSLMFLLCMVWPFLAPSVTAQSWVDEGVREFEELRMRQLQTVQSNGDIAPFTTDGCSGGQSQNWELLANTLPGFEEQFGDMPPWDACCVAHDKTYWRGSTVDGYTKRRHADEELKRCVAATGARLAPQLSLKYSVTEEKVRQVFSLTAELMYQAVRIGGQPCSLLPWRWGYGWANCAFAGVSDTPESYSEIKHDENISVFNTAGWLDPGNRHWYIPIHLWIYEPQDSVVRRGVSAALLEAKYDLNVTPDTEDNFRRRINLLIADNERGKNIVIRITGQDITLPASKENGHVFTILKLPADVVNAFADQGRLHFFIVTQPQDKRRFEGDVQLVPRSGISIISDIDDTIKITNATDRKRLFENTFFKDFREVSGMPELYQQLVARDVTIHFVSSSPWQLYGPLQEFARKAGFPWATMNLKDVRFRDETVLNMFKKGTETKPGQIEPILRRFSKRRFILIGDSGEQDPEVYGDIARRFPSQIHRILIRNVNSSDAEDGRYRKSFKNIAGSRWRLFNQPEKIAVDELLDN